MRVRLHYYRDPIGNFGDDLNPWLWSRLIPGAVDLGAQAGDADVVLIGIGTILGDHLDQLEGHKVIIGSGFGYRSKPPQLGPDWTVLCVRGPLTAAALNLSPSFAVTDAALLIRSFVDPRAEWATDVGFMPHHRSAQSGAWEEVVKSAGLKYLCPHKSVDETLDRMRYLRLLITEAMHGAIVADALRIPWIPVRAAPWILDFKWRDWCASMEIEHRFEALWPFPWLLATAELGSTIGCAPSATN